MIHCIRLSKLILWSFIFFAFILFFFILSPLSPSLTTNRNELGGDHYWEKHVTKLAYRNFNSKLTVLVTGAAGFLGCHVSLFLKRVNEMRHVSCNVSISFTSLILSKLGGTEVREIRRVAYRLLAPMDNRVFRFQLFRLQWDEHV
ncbi:hypothetical protein Ahy_B08g090892 [Arachis hypogaea]|uniref:Uncharacterized protein n=1 Tax=Arachis hypogaea TaxID=3818 RepID=A0A444Y0T7_ARAHY|nr:hypothetical protein Ahy_B08g090892 [Arachis hypogaea]